MNTPFREWTEEQKERNRENSRRYKQKNREKVNAANRAWRAAHPAYMQAYNQEHYRLFRKRRLADGRRRYAVKRDMILAQQREHYRQQRIQITAELERIAAMMANMESDATRTFMPNVERLGIFVRTKRKDKIVRGKKPAQTVALRLAARKGEAMLVEAEAKDVIAAARRKPAVAGFRGWTHVTRTHHVAKIREEMST